MFSYLLKTTRPGQKLLLRGIKKRPDNSARAFNIFYKIAKSLFGFGYSVYSYKKGAITKATTDINFNRMLRDGPEVSLNGSPTVSPTTVAL